MLLTPEDILFGPFQSDHPISAIGRFEAEMHAQGGIVLFVNPHKLTERDEICTWLEATLGDNRDFEPGGRWCASYICTYNDTSSLDAYGLFQPLDEVIFRLRFSEKIVTPAKAWRLAHIQDTIERMLVETDEMGPPLW